MSTRPPLPRKVGGGVMWKTAEREEGRAKNGNARKIDLKRNRIGIWGRPSGPTAPYHTFSGRTFPSQTARLYLEPFKSNRGSKLTIVKKSLQKFNVFRIISDTPGGCHPMPYILERSFHAQYLPHR